MKERSVFFNYLEYTAVFLFFFILRLFPFPVRAWLCEIFALALYYTATPALKTLTKNVNHAFPDKSETWKKKLIKNNVINMGRQLAEFIQTPAINDNFFKKWFVPLPDAQSHQKIYSDGGICILGHLGNWEWHGFLAGKLSGRDIYTLVKRQRNPIMNRYVEKLRNQAHMQFIYIDQNAFMTISKLRKGNLVAFTSDQNARSSGEFFPFFGRLASTYLGPASVARNTKVPVYFVWSYRDNKKRLNFEFQEIQKPEIPKENIKEWEKAFTQSWVQILESKIKEHPEDYLWAHNRWKTQPENPEEVWKEFN
ncbi:MAG: lysophospholipid acyltransferase family protein [Spirochaetia bacterium]|nr:lysophospholipid acyltransferase family protein [Spirochaetia bacterium]